MLEKFNPWSVSNETEILSSKELAIQQPEKRSILKVFKVRALALDANVGLTGLFTKTDGRNSYEESPYDFAKILDAIDTDSYVKQAISKYKELIWKEGWEIISENVEAVDYLYQRIDYMELIMERPFNEFLVETMDQLIKFHNVFIGISRGDIRPLFPGNLKPEAGKDTVSGFYLIPTEQVEIKRDKHNRTLGYKQRLDPTGFSNQDGSPTWTEDQVIHLYIDRKPGRAYGTPFLISVLDDVVALRQIEEDVQNLIHKELFPLFLYRVGTEDRPATQDEITDAYNELENLRTDGGLILPDRHDVDVIGSEGKALDIEFPMGHFKERVASGLGVFPHHLGMSTEGGNRSVTDRLDTALYDKIKSYQRYIANAIRMYIFDPLLKEGGFDPWVARHDEESVSDKCIMRFREIDVETQVKRETNAANKFAQNVQTWEETRLELGLDPEVDPDGLMMNMQHKLTMEQAMETTKLTAALAPPPPPPEISKTVSKSPTGGTSTKITKPISKPDAQKPSTGVKPNTPNNIKGLGQLQRPSNQHKRRTSPIIRHTEEPSGFVEWLDELVELVDESENE